MYSRVIATIRPSSVAAAKAFGCICHATQAMTTAVRKLTGIVYLAGQRNPARRIPATTIGATANKLRTNRLSTSITPFRASSPRSPRCGDNYSVIQKYRLLSADPRQRSWRIEHCPGIEDVIWVQGHLDPV